MKRLKTSSSTRFSPITKCRTITFLCGIMALHAQANLHNTPAEDNHTNRLNRRKHKRREIIDCRQWVCSCGEGSCCAEQHGA